MLVAVKWVPMVLVLLFLVTATSQQFGGNNSNRRGGSRDQCPKTTLKNGKVKPRSSGRVVKYACNRDYILVGESTSTCLQGEWTSEPPVCATKGCSQPQPPPSGRFVSSSGGAVLRLECNPGYTPAGPPMIYCVDKFDWNGTAPLCQASGSRQTTTRCDFESDDLCGWLQDATSDDFDWQWQNYGTPSSHLGTGPSFDHTLGAGKAGHYLFIESSSPRMDGDKARLYSPVYGPPETSSSDSDAACFTFWYHMYGSATGRLQVYVKKEGNELKDTTPGFVRAGDQGNQWRQGYVDLSNVKENFQLVIEGVRGTGYVGDTAIDDVDVVYGENCTSARSRMEADAIPSSGAGGTKATSTVAPNASCAARCSALSLSTSTPASVAATPEESEWTCGCSDDCLLKNSCCVDYATFCLTDGLQADDQSRFVDRPSSSASQSRTRWLTIGAIGGGVSLLVLSALGIAGAMRVRRNKMLHLGSHRPKQQDRLAEDSDVRYLRDEDDVQLDLTEATPAPAGTRSAGGGSVVIGGSGTQQHRQFADFERL